MTLVNLGDTWTWDGTTWTPHTVTNPPCPRHSTRLAYDVTNRVVVMFGGKLDQTQSNCPAQLENDTWTWDGTTWSPGATGPTARESEGLSWDGAGSQVLLYGGYGVCPTEATQCGDTWFWKNQAWTQCDPNSQCSPSNSPPRLSGMSLTYHGDRNVVVLYGGKQTDGSLYDQTWTWNGQAWTHTTGLSGPGLRADHRTAYDPVKKAMLLFGGCLQTCSPDEGAPGAVDNHTWSLDGGNWSPWSPVASPSARCCYGMDYGPVGTGSTIALFGGADLTHPIGMPDMWKWSWSANGGKGKWTCISPVGTCLTPP